MKKRGRREKYVCVCVCVRQRMSLRGGGREDCLHRPITKKQALRRGPIITRTGARFHRDDAGMMLPAYWLLERQCTLQHREAVGGQQRNKCPVQTDLNVLLQWNTKDINVWHRDGCSSWFSNFTLNKNVKKNKKLAKLSRKKTWHLTSIHLIVY